MQKGNNRQVWQFSVVHSEQKAKLLGHIARCPDEDPLRQISFKPKTVQRVEYGKKRVGKPRQNWIHQAKKYVYVEKMHMFSYSESSREDEQILERAVRRHF